MSKFDELERKLLEYEYQLKACKDRSAAQEAHHAKIIGDVTAKMNGTIAQVCSFRFFFCDRRLIIMGKCSVVKKSRLAILILISLIKSLRLFAYIIWNKYI